MTAWRPTYLAGGDFVGYVRDHGDIRLAVIPDAISFCWSLSRGGRVLADGRVEHAYLGCEAADVALSAVLVADRKAVR